MGHDNAKPLVGGSAMLNLFKERFQKLRQLGRIKPSAIDEGSGPFTYEYEAIFSVQGVKLQVSETDRLSVFLSSLQDAEVFLTNDWDSHCMHMDSSTAIAVLMLTGFNGRRKFGKLSTYLNRASVLLFGSDRTFKRNLRREVKAVKEARRSANLSHGCWLIYRASGELISPPELKSARCLGNIGWGLDAIDLNEYRVHHKAPSHSLATALSLALNDANASPDIRFVQDGIHVKGRNGFVLYPRTFEAGHVSVLISSVLTEGTLDSASAHLPALLADSNLESAVSIFVHSQTTVADNVRSFISAWAALELLVNILWRRNWKDWVDLFESNYSSVPEWERDFRKMKSSQYALRDKFFAVACVLDLDCAAADAEIFTRAHKLRNLFYHRREGADQDLPTGEVQNLFRKFLKLTLSNVK